MTPAELFARPPERTDHRVSILRGCYYDFLPDLDERVNWGVIYDLDKLCERDQRISIAYWKDFDFDGRRFWRLAGVRFDGEPVMIAQNAGREGDDHAHAYVIDLDAYKEMVEYLFKLAAEVMKPSDFDHKRMSLVDKDADLGRGLIEFYGNALDGHFERYHY